MQATAASAPRKADLILITIQHHKLQLLLKVHSYSLFAIVLRPKNVDVLGQCFGRCGSSCCASRSRSGMSGNSVDKFIEMRLHCQRVFYKQDSKAHGFENKMLA